MDDPSVLMSGDYELLDEGESESTIDLTYGTPTKLEPAQPMPVADPEPEPGQNPNLNQKLCVEPEPEPEPEPQPALPNNVSHYRETFPVYKWTEYDPTSEVTVIWNDQVIYRLDDLDTYPIRIIGPDGATYERDKEGFNFNGDWYGVIRVDLTEVLNQNR